ncbi:hypothetical protein [Kibdelosporangium philippinense]|uniref:hypothetical protein n=1 Tax=Kibdelosporangium philippinense TaxID=211113 RepID=UPI0036112044
MVRAAAGTATSASGHPHGRTTAQANTSRRRVMEMASASHALRTSSIPSIMCREGLLTFTASTANARNSTKSAG